MENKGNLNSCLMLTANLQTPVSLSAIFDDSDLKDTGIELDSHITLLYAQGRDIPRANLLNDIKDILGYDDTVEFLKYLEEEREENVLDIFDLGKFENESDYVVLKMKEDFGLFKYLRLINKGLAVKYEVPSKFDSYTPHLTLAESNPGTAQKYLDSETLRLVLKDSVMDFEDLIISYGSDNEVKDRLQYHLTSYAAVDRYFRLLELEKENREN